MPIHTKILIFHFLVSKVPHLSKYKHLSPTCLNFHAQYWCCISLAWARLPLWMSISFSYSRQVLSPGNSHKVRCTSNELQCFNKHELNIYLLLCMCEHFQMFGNINTYSIKKNPKPTTSYVLIWNFSSFSVSTYFLFSASQCFCIPFWCRYSLSLALGFCDAVTSW